jgi:hypothetical protein
MNLVPLFDLKVLSRMCNILSRTFKSAARVGQVWRRREQAAST